jgi:predicted RNA methylase
MTYYLHHSDWYQSAAIPEGMLLDMINAPTRLDILLKPSIDNMDKDKIFIDLGCGTGVLGLHALSKGAKFVYFVERDPQMAFIINNILPNKIDPSKFKIINKDIETLEISDFNMGIPEVVVSEFFGPRLFDEGYVNYTKHIRSLFPECFFIPEIFKGEFYIADINYNDPIWPKDANLVNHFKFMYRDKAFSKNTPFSWWFNPKISNHMGSITFDANKQEFKNSLEFNYNFKEDKIVAGVMTVGHNDLRQDWIVMGWVLTAEDYNKNFKIHFDTTDYFNPRMVEV